MGNSTVSFGSFLPIELRGVRLEAARIVHNAGNDHHKITATRKLQRTPTPGEVIVHGFVKETAISESFAEHLARNPGTSHLVGACNVFLSHTWGTPFEETIEALEAYESDLPNGSPPCFYFIDYFAVNQFNVGSDLDKLGGIVQRCKSVVLLAKPWHAPQTLSRAWCIFEIAHAVLGKSDLQLIMSAEEKRRFKRALREKLNSFGEANKFINIFNIESSKMEATKPEDLKTIRDFMKDKLGGFDGVDLTVARGLRAWVGKTAVKLCDSFKPTGTHQHASFLLDVGNLLSVVGLHEDKLRLAGKARKIYENTKDEGNKEISMAHEGIALGCLGRHDEAIKLKKELVDLSIKRYGETHEKTLTHRYNLGVSYMKIMLWDEAEKQLTVTLNGFKEIQRPMSLKIRGTQSKLAQVLRDSGKDMDRAKLLYKEKLDWSIKKFGLYRPSVMVTGVDHARCLALEGEHSQALKYYKKAFPVLLKVYGEKDVHVKSLRVWIKEAEFHLREK